MGDYNLQRFLDAQQGDYERALTEVRNGRKHSHWIWYIFPQLKGLGMSYNSQYYGISGKEEAEAYWAHPILGERLREITSAFLQLKGKTAQDVFGALDAMKVLSCMTLFNEVAPDGLFQQVIEQYYRSETDEMTKRMLDK
ncbi:DUF1810 domain-containing protein [uncultured Bacteroides sp.]|jgi:uncharacterized protein (DUF1810 family)|uniref:DUF1810 domain-containing protein n=1 Tax=uncultured Bacteroides sp. TaxID=162156 RepID=UPI0025898E6E|nr:DUF1810 domain-containing protein [uncultured Bacteroides sp.]